MTTEKGQVGMEITKEKSLSPPMEVSKMVTERGLEAGIRMITIGKVQAVKQEDTKCFIFTKIIYFFSLVTTYAFYIYVLPISNVISYLVIDLLMYNVNKVIDS